MKLPQSFQTLGLMFALSALALQAQSPTSGQPTSAAKRHLLIAYSWGSTNIGDDAILPGFLTLLGDVRPEMPVAVLSAKQANDPVLGRARNHVSEFSRDGRVVPFPFGSFRALINEGRDPAGSRGKALAAFRERWGASTLRAYDNGSVSAAKAARMADDVLNRLPREVLAELQQEAPEAARSFTDAGFVMYSSGMVLNFGRVGERNFWGYTLRNIMPLLIARAHGIPYGINGHSFEAIEWPAELIHRQLFQDARFVYCRDPDSVEYLRQRNLLAPKTAFGPDNTIHFRKKDDAWADDFMKRHGLAENRFITVTVRNAVSQDGSLSEAIPIEREREQMATMRGFIEAWIKRTGNPVVLCPESKREVPWHYKNIYLQLTPEARKKCVLTHEDVSYFQSAPKGENAALRGYLADPRAHFWKVEQAVALYGRAEMVVSMEMHSVLMALSCGTPPLMIQFLETGRKASMLEELKLGDCLFDIDEPGSGTRLLEAALRIHADRATAAERVRSQLPRLRQISTGAIAEIEAAWRH